MTYKIIVEGMHCENCAMRIKKVLSNYGKNIEVDLNEKLVTLTTDDIDTVTTKINDLGFEVKEIEAEK